MHESLLEKVMQTLKHQTTRMWRGLKVVPPTPVEARKKVKITLGEPMLQEDMSIMQVAMNIIKESQGRTSSEVHQDNPHLPGINLIFWSLLLLYNFLAPGKRLQVI